MAELLSILDVSKMAPPFDSLTRFGVVNLYFDLSLAVQKLFDLFDFAAFSLETKIWGSWEKGSPKQSL